MANINNTPESWKKQWSKPMSFLYNYKPMRIKEVTANDWNIRKLIWSFKDGKASDWCAEVVAMRLMKEYGEKMKSLVFACIPASSAEKNEIRYKRFAEKVCQLTGCINGFQAINVSGQRLAIHETKEGKQLSNTQVISFDDAFFNGKEVVVFDDIITRGRSYARFACAIEAIGASVVGGIFLGRTI